MKPLVAIGDIHGSTDWKAIVEKHPDCRIVFLGDYLDPIKYIPRKQLLQNLSPSSSFLPHFLQYMLSSRMIIFYLI